MTDASTTTPGSSSASHQCPSTTIDTSPGPDGVTPVDEPVQCRLYRGHDGMHTDAEHIMWAD